jgi:hypothetical protein
MMGKPLEEREAVSRLEGSSDGAVGEATELDLGLNRALGEWLSTILHLTLAADWLKLLTHDVNAGQHASVVPGAGSATRWSVVSTKYL